MQNKSTFIGSVQDVNGSCIRIIMSNESLFGLSYIDGQGYKIGQIGSFIKIPIGYIDLYGVISQVGASAVPDKLILIQPSGNRWITVQLIGEATRAGNFQRGVSQFPIIGDEAHVVTENDLHVLYGLPDEPQYVQIGNIASAEAIPALLDIDKFITRHSAIVGSTGSGKSNTVTSILKSITSGKFPKAKIILIDPHSEYKSALASVANIFSLDSTDNPLKIPFWGLSYNELALILFDKKQASDSQQDILFQDKILNDKHEIAARLKLGSIPDEEITINSPIPFNIKKILYDLYIEEFAIVNTKADLSTIAYKKDGSGGEMKGDYKKVVLPVFLPPGQGSAAPFKYKENRILNSYLNKLYGKLKDTRLKFLFETDEYDGITKDLDNLLDSWLNHDKPITILDLGGVPFEIMDLVIGLICRIVFESMFWGRYIDGFGRKRPVLMVFEEAHTYLPRGGSNQFVLGYACNAVRRICKEGRKYGIGASIISQRPSELDDSILSQCGTFISLRLSNSDDQGIIRSSIPDSSFSLSELLPSLRTGEAIIVGEAVKIPSRVIIPLMHPRPDSSDPLPSKEWNDISIEQPDFPKAINSWRKQTTLK